MSELETFRQETRDWLEANCPAAMRTPMTGEADICWGGKKFTFQSADQKLWLERMGNKGWTAPTWPKEYGGGGLMRQEAEILADELKRIGARPALVSFGVWMLGPALLKFGSEAQKREHLPKIVKGEIRWAQGYSEPNAGSDLAALATRAEDCGDHYKVTGQKVWTSYADKADWIFCLVRTDPTVKQAGISFVLIDMDQPGVTPKPIKLISGSSPFCETFFDNAVAKKENLVGTLNKGWDIAKYLLTHEREAIGGDMGGGGLLGDVVPADFAAFKAHYGLDFDGGDRIAAAKLDIQGVAFAATVERIMAEAQAGQSLGATSSMLKYVGSELNKDRYELMIKLMGLDALAWDGDIARPWLRSKGNSIEGGTSEVQLNIVSKHILGLG